MHDKSLAGEIRRYRLQHRLTWSKLAGRIPSWKADGRTMSVSGIWKIATEQVEATELTEHLIREALDIPKDERRDETREVVQVRREHGESPHGAERQEAPGQ